MAQLNTRIILRNDSTANWLLNESQVLLKGEVGIEFLTDGKVKMKIGDGIKTWSELSYFGGEETHVFEADVGTDQTPKAALEQRVGNSAVVKGDIGIVKKALGNEHYEYTAYVYNGTDWAAMDGNYDASNVYFSKNLIFTQNFGKYAPDASGSVTVPTLDDNMSLENLFLKAYSEEKNPKTTDPSVSWSTNPTGSKEVGTKVSPSYNASLSAGSYTYGPATGITAKSWEVSVANLGDTAKTTSSGTFSEFTVTDGMSGYAKVTAKASYDAGAVPKTNLGNDYAAGQIPAGSKSITSNGYSGYRQWFYGYIGKGNAVKNIDDIDSDFIRKGGSSLNGANMIGRGTNESFPGTITVDRMQQMFFAIPSTKNKTTVKVENNVNGAPQTVKGPITKYVKGANDYAVTTNNGDNTTEGLAYDFFYISNDNADSSTSTTFKITVS